MRNAFFDLGVKILQQLIALEQQTEMPLISLSIDTSSLQIGIRHLFHTPQGPKDSPCCKQMCELRKQMEVMVIRVMPMKEQGKSFPLARSSNSRSMMLREFLLRLPCFFGQQQIDTANHVVCVWEMHDGHNQFDLHSKSKLFLHVRFAQCFKKNIA